MVYIENEKGKLKEYQFIQMINGVIIDTTLDDLQMYELKEHYGWVVDKNYLWYTRDNKMIRCLGRIECGLIKLPKE